MEFGRASGILLHPTSLPGRVGIGSLGAEAHRFVDFLAGAGQKLWQVLPLGPTGYGDSPYQCFSSFAGNPLLIDLEGLVADGCLSPDELADAPRFPDDEVDYGSVHEFKEAALKKSFETFYDRAAPAIRHEYAAFCQAQSSWLDDYALFSALKDAHHGAPWTAWAPAIARREPAAVSQWRVRLRREIEACKCGQYQFFRQWAALKQRCHARGIKLIGDIPIFVAHDSADVWAHPELFHLDAHGQPTVVAGVPPDYFSATGQLWGNPIYRWEAMAPEHAWWVERLRWTLSLVDIVRLDHFRGFEAYWEIPGDAPTAAHGRWVKGPGAALFAKLLERLGDLPVVAENLGAITPDVEALRRQFHFPGMAVLQFAFGNEVEGSTFLPHNYTRDLVAYTGTHDNDTTVGWWNAARAGTSTRSAEDIRRERDFARRYLAIERQPIHWVFIRAALSSVASMAIIPLQDVLGLGSQARMNTPATSGGNWRWRYTAGMLTDDVRERLRQLTVLYGR
jgi:4-alpha-glucanotransferase